MVFLRFVWIFIDFKWFWGQKVWQPVAACGGLWRPVAACGSLWQRSWVPLRNFAARQAGRTGRAGRQDRQGRQAGRQEGQQAGRQAG